MKTARLGLVLLGWLLALPMAWGRGGGGCLAEGTRIATPQGPVAIEHLQRGDVVWTFQEGKFVQGAVQGATQTEAEGLVELVLPGRRLLATPEHPVQVGEGLFRAAGRLRADDQVLVSAASLANHNWSLVTSAPADCRAAENEMIGGGLAYERLQSVRRLAGLRRVFNLLVMPGGVYVAEGVVVHNKGCFLPDTPILLANGSHAMISEVRVGDRLRAFTPDGALVNTTVREIYQVQAGRYYEVRTDRALLRVTGEHPFYLGNGAFKTVAALRAGDKVFAAGTDALLVQKVVSITEIPSPVTVYNLRTDAPHTYFAAGIAVHNKGGGCFRAGTLIATLSGEQAIETLQRGDRVWAWQDGSRRLALVQSLHAVQPAEYCALTIAGRTVYVTAEHPIMVAEGIFRTAGSLRAGDTVFTSAPNLFPEPRPLTTSLSPRGGEGARRAGEGERGVHGFPSRENSLSNSPTVIESVARVPADAPAFNLSVLPGGTFIADGVVAHNKGCFLPDTPILQADGSTVQISQVRPGDRLRAFTLEGELAEAIVQRVFQAEAEVHYVVATERSRVRVTAEHPFYVGDGTFKTVSALRPGDKVFAAETTGLTEQGVLAIEQVPGKVTVYNLQTDAPHTYFAAGLAVHNKGFSGGSRRGGSGGGGKSWSEMSKFEKAVFVGAFGIFGVIFLTALIAGKLQSSKSENLDFLFSRKKIEAKAGKTLKLLEFIARVDPAFQPDALREAARTTFLKLQECWQAREYGPMQELLMPDLYRDHLRQINGMIRNHEINRMEGLRIIQIDLVNVRYTHQPGHREFTALFTANVRDYYVDDRSGSWLRGDREPATFQEFWTFQLVDARWSLREIEQTGESDILKDENFFEQFTDPGVKEVYGEAAKAQGEAGPWLEKEVETKATRTERLLNFLAQTDKLWNRETMLRRAREVFLAMKLAQENGDPSAAPVADLFPEAAADLQTTLQSRREKVLAVEYRNLCVRKVELILVRNFADNGLDEYTVRISAHAQQIHKRSGYVLRRDEDVAPFEEYLTFGRLDGQWKLKEIVPPARGSRMAKEENVDEESSPDQLQWYYQQTRAV